MDARGRVQRTPFLRSDTRCNGIAPKSLRCWPKGSFPIRTHDQVPNACQLTECAPSHTAARSQVRAPSRLTAGSIGKQIIQLPFRGSEMADRLAALMRK